MIFLSLVAISITINTSAQKKTFIRLYDITGHKFAKGFFTGTTDSSIMLISRNIKTEIPVNKIGIIKTKRSAGNSMLTGALIGAVPGAIIFAAGSTGDDGFLTYTLRDGIVGGFFGGAVAGAIVGAIVSAGKKRELYKIDGKMENWLQQKILLDKITVYRSDNKSE